ncbi:hypothetical protein DEU56DRAFT_908470 [Suillus clintonianus]|uniref:uncharacterized protein n=1 Tax=Suillus clintonianus TaxID=1904413 RepID=UPI001B87BF03|nr:uncharacterized protein DEU56DRAFT_908470 [Suillus clintonianus]KAG2150829.1 hypothetical protein DEU56DRAFT_908470 [Suillus clintonianus]
MSSAVSPQISLVSYLVDDKSPLINYDNTWAPGTSADSLADQYFRGTFTTSNVTGSVAKFSFNGTAFWIYGAKRGNHGTYTVTVDNSNFAGNTGQSNTALFQQVLFNQSGLSQGLHTVSLTNTATGSLYVDIDMVVWQTEFNGTQLLSETVDDADARFQYQEPAWNTNPTYVNLFNNGTGHSTSVSDASVTFTFTGMSSLSCPSNGFYSVSLDSGQATQYNATAYVPCYEVMLYHADNLGSGQHQLTLVNLPQTSGQTLNIDYAVLTSSSSSNSSSSSGSGLPGSTSGTSPSSVNAASTSTSLGSGAIAGIVVAIGVALCASAAAFFFYRRFKSAQAASQDLYRIRTPQHSPGNANMGASSSVDTRSNASLIRPDTSSQGTSWRSYQQAEYDSQVSPRNGNGRHVPSSSMPTVDEVIISSSTQSPVDEIGTSRRPLPAAPGTQQNIFQLPVPNESLGISKATPVQRRASAQSGSATIGDIPPPPDYMQATR